MFLHLASKIQDFQSIIQVYQLDFESWIIKLKNLDFCFDKPRFSICCTFGVKNLGLSSDNPSFFNLLTTSWIIKSKNLDFTLIIQDFRLIVQSKLKILDYRLKIQVFQSQCPIIWKTWIFESKNLGLSSDNPSFFNHISKILDYQLKVQVLLENLRLSIENLGFSTDNPRCWSKIQDFLFIGHWAYHKYHLTSFSLPLMYKVTIILILVKCLLKYQQSTLNYQKLNGLKMPSKKCGWVWEKFTKCLYRIFNPKSQPCSKFYQII